MTKPVPETLRDLAKLYEQRNKVYGNNYKKFGNILFALFPDGLTFKDADDFNRLGVFVQLMSKLSRYTENFNKGGHADSLDDLAVYTMMLQELDGEIREANSGPDVELDGPFEPQQIRTPQYELPEGLKHLSDTDLGPAQQHPIARKDRLTESHPEGCICFMCKQDKEIERQRQETEARLPMGAINHGRDCFCYTCIKARHALQKKEKS